MQIEPAGRGIGASPRERLFDLVAGFLVLGLAVARAYATDHLGGIDRRAKLHP
jgi:hypothetical protein